MSLSGKAAGLKAILPSSPVLVSSLDLTISVLFMSPDLSIVKITIVKDLNIYNWTQDDLKSCDEETQKLLLTISIAIWQLSKKGIKVKATIVDEEE